MGETISINVMLFAKIMQQRIGYRIRRALKMAGDVAPAGYKEAMQ